MSSVFFTATKHALENITSTYDTVWPIAVGLWNLRCMVNGTKHEYEKIPEAELVGKFCLGSGIHGVNLKRAFYEKTWKNQQIDFAWILLNSACSIYEAWIAELKQTRFTDLKVKKMQFPIDLYTEVTRLKNSPSPVMQSTFYSAYQGMKDRCYTFPYTLRFRSFD